MNHKKRKKENVSLNNQWDRFWVWYNHKISANLVILAIIIYLQIPHMIWAGDVYLQIGLISRIHPVLDFLLYGIDLIEVLGMINIGMMIYARVRKNAIH